MNHLYRRLKLIFSTFLVMATLGSSTAFAQLDDIGEFLRAGTEDAERLTRAYLSPLPTGLSTSLNSGWNGTAAPRKTLGFSIDVRVAAAFVPDSDQDFNLNEIGLQNVEPADQLEFIAPTISGDDGDAPTVNLFADTGVGGRQQIGSFELPSGSGVSLVPAPMIQASLGLIKDTDITVRFIPETDLDDYGDISLFGGSVKHGINQWLPGGNLLPVDISLQAGFTQVELNANLDALGGNDQRVETTTNTFVLNALVGKTLPFISIYGGAGIQSGDFEVDVLGDFEVQTIAGTTTITDPISYTEDSEASVHLLGGVRFKLAIFNIYAEGTVAEYSSLNAGIGFSFR